MDPVQLLIELGVIPGPSGAGPMPGHATAQMPGALSEVQGDPMPAPPAFPPGSQPMAQAAPPGYPSVVTAPMPVPTINPNLAPAGPLESTDPYATLQQMLEPSMGPQPGEPSRQGGYGAGPSPQGGQQAPAAAPSGGSAPQGQPPAAVPGTPTPASPTTAPTGASTGAGQSALSAPDSRGRLFQMLSIMGAVLAQPAGPGSNTMGQVAKALAMGNLYNDSMNRADQERSDVRVKQELDTRRVAAEEQQVRQGGQRVGIAQQGANTDQALAAAKIRTMDAELQLMPASVEKARYQTELARIHAMSAGPEAIQKLQLLDSQIQQHKAHTEQILASTGTPEDRVRARIMDTIKPYMGDGSPGSMNIPGAVMALGTSAKALGLKDRTPADDAAGKQAYDALRKKGYTPAEADQAILSIDMQQSRRPRQFSIGDKR